MRTFLWLSALGVATLAVGGCTQPPPPKPDVRLVASIQDIMLAIIDPAADEIWNSVATVVSAAGTEERAPSTPEEWKKVRNDAISVIEAMNLLLMDGRRVAEPGFKSENPGIELEPEEVEKLIADDRPALVELARKLQDAAGEALAAIDRKDVPGLLESGEKMDTACENCHLKYWYPNDPANKKRAPISLKP